MPIVPISNPESEELIDELLRRVSAFNEEYSISLSPHASALLRLTAEAWMGDPPAAPLPLLEGAEYEGEEMDTLPPDIEPLESIDNFGREEWLSLAIEVYEESLENERVQKQRREGEIITYPILFHALAEAGDQILGLGYKRY